MRSPQGKLRRANQFLSLLLLCFSGIGGGAPAIGQAQDPSLPTLPGPAGSRAPFGQQQDANQDPALRRAQDEAAKRRNTDRQNRLVADSDKLLQLAQELKAEVSKSSKNTLSVTVVKKAEEIEKLAKSVKDRMRSE